MNYWPEDFDRRRDGVYIPTIGVTIALSLLLHVAVIWQWKFQLRAPSPDKDIPPPLTVKLEPLPGPPPAPAAAFIPPPSVAIPQPRAAPAAPPPVAARPPPATPPPVIALNPPVPAEPAIAVPAPPRTAPVLDFASFIEAQRRARGESATAAPSVTPPVEDENTRATRLAVANLATQKAQPLGYDPSRSGGVFQIKSKGVDYAEFMFYGWHADARRDLAQLVEVRKGSNSNIELAVVRKMIEIIRSYEQADFSWRSHRLNRNVMLSARPRDSAGLEEFLMREFFYNPRIAP